jgi:hypothetical protein
MALIVLSGVCAATAVSQSVAPLTVSADTSFPFDIGNSWYYSKWGSPVSNIGEVKSIIGTLSPSKGGVIVGVSYLYPDSITHGTEYWSWREGKLYRTSDSSNWPVLPIYDAHLTHDTSWSPTSGVMAGYSLFSHTQFGITTSGQKYWSNASRSGYSSSVWESAALRIGFLEAHSEVWLNGPIYSYTLQIVGMIVNGVVYGDTTLATFVDGHSIIPSSFGLLQNYPNPFNPTTVIGCQLPMTSDVKLVVYDLLGREVSVLVNERKDSGVYDVKFDGSNLASGVYFYRLQAGTFVETKKLLLIR